jgi:hypothetical protein
VGLGVGVGVGVGVDVSVGLGVCVEVAVGLEVTVGEGNSMGGDAAQAVVAASVSRATMTIASVVFMFEIGG